MNASAPVFNPRPPLAGRYRLGPVIGIGGFGTVFDAYDETTKSRVAVKSLRQIDPQRLFCFKQEFRLLADCRHRNLVQYYELFQERDRWYLAMEHVDGIDVMSHVRGAETPAIDSTTMTHSVSVEMPWEGPQGRSPSDRSGEVAVAAQREIERIRALLPQIADGLEHLHANNLVHRDLTPRNIMLGRDGRLVILDFGLALRGSGTSMMRNLRVGTPKYMAPEQVSSEPSTPAADWYAVGSILYEMLTGIAPFVGSSHQILADKRTRPPLDPRQLHPHLPDDLCQLAMDCLATDPLARPTDGVERLRACAVAATPTRVPARVNASVPFVGRDDQLGRLDQAWRWLVKDRSGGVVLVRGPSGMGKSALIDRFVQRLPASDRLLLRSRCYQHESVPFKALDGLADAIGEYLQDTPEEELARILPDGLQYLARLFPALRMIPRIELKVEADSADTSQLDPHEQRRRGFQALRALFHRLADGRQVVITLDDLQWGDEDSLAALTEVLAPPGAPPVLVIACGRTEDGGAQVLDRMAQVFGTVGIRVESLEVGPLSSSEIAELAGSLLTGDSTPTAALDAAHRDSGGHPLFLRELVLAHAQGAAGNRPSLRDLLARRLMALDESARRLVEVAAVAGRPRTLALLHHAIGDVGNLAAAVHQLGADRLVRLRTSFGRDELGLYHDKVAETAIALLSPDKLVSHHAALAKALSETEDPEIEAEALSMHLLAAGDRAGGWRYGIIAADRAAAALAFDRAAALYRKLLDIMPADVDRSAFLMKMADALANAGHGIEAAKAYGEAAANPAFADRLHALQRAAGQYLRSGYMDDGLTIAKQVLGEVGLKWHESSISALLSLLMRRTWLRIRGMKFTEQDPASIPRSTRIKMDALWSLGHGLGGVDTVRGAEFHIRHLHLALQAGDPYRVGRGLAWESILNAAEGGTGGRRRGRAQVALGHDLAKKLGNEHAAAWSWAAEGYNNWCDGRWDDALACNEKAAKGYREECLDITWELGSVYAWCWGPVLCYSGRLTELRALISQVEREFGQLGDLYTLVTLRTVVKPWLTLADGEPERARRESADAVAQWSKKHWHLQHLFDRMADARVALYQGDGGRAADLIDDGFPKYTKTMQNLLQVKRMFMHGLRGQAVIMAVMQGKRDAAALAVADKDAKRLSKEGTAWAASYATHLRAALHLARGNTSAAVEGYHATVTAFDQLKMPLHAAAARIRLGRTANDERVVKDGITALHALGVKEPERYAATLVAGPAIG